MPIKPLLTDVVESYLKGANLTLSYSEVGCIESFLALEEEAQHHYQRLYLRKSPVQRIDKLDLPEAIFLVLKASSFIKAITLAPIQSMEMMTRAELANIYSQLPKRAPSKKREMIDGLTPFWSHQWAPPLVWIAHQKVFRRAVRWFTAHPDGNIERLIIQELGHRHYLSRGQKNQTALFASRKDRRHFEWARQLSPFKRSKPPTTEALLDVLQKLSKSDSPPFSQRFSPKLRLFRSLNHWVEAQYKGDLNQALEWLALIPPTHQPPQLVRKVALQCQKEKRSPDGLNLLNRILPLQRLDERLSLLQSYNQMAHKLRKPRQTLPALSEPKTREITLIQSGHHKNRPTFRVNDDDLTIENAVCAQLKSDGHQAIFAEGTHWLALMILLFWEAFTAPIPNQLPSPVLSAPLDFGSPDFALRRMSWIEPIFQDIQNGHAQTLLQSHIQHLNMTARGLGSHRLKPTELILMVQKTPPQLLAAVLRILLFDAQQKSKGMPDLIVFPQNDQTFKVAFPNRFRSPFLLAELKTPSDKLSPAQKVWFHRLNEANVPAELWQITPKDWSPQ